MVFGKNQLQELVNLAGEALKEEDGFLRSCYSSRQVEQFL